MKTTRKLLALLLALTMILGFATVAFAAADLSSHTFTAYQIFSARAEDNPDSPPIPDNTLYGLDWGNGISPEGKIYLSQVYGGNGTAVDVAKHLQENTSDAKKFAQDAYKYIVAANGIELTDDATVNKGYYLIVDTTSGTPDPNVYNVSVLYVRDDNTAIHPTSKVTVPTVDKVIVDGSDTGTKTNSEGMGKTVPYQITATLPENLDDFETYYYKFTDTLSKGLDYQNDMVVTVDGIDATEYFYVGATENYDPTDTAHENKLSTTIIVGMSDLLRLNNVPNDGDNPVFAITKDSKIVLKYSAVVNKNAVILGSGNPNDVVLEYSNKPDDSGDPSNEPPTPPTPPTTNKPTGVTPKSEVVTYVTRLTITKTDSLGKILAGAEFKLVGATDEFKVVTRTDFVIAPDGTTETLYYKLNNGTYTTTPPSTAADADNSAYAQDSLTKTYIKSTWTEVLGAGQSNVNIQAAVGGDGMLTFNGLGAGEYTLTEAVVPDGYNGIDPITFTVTFVLDGDGKPDFGVTGEGAGKINIDSPAVNELAATIVNKSGALLPETGGIGTTLFYVFGSILVVGAGILLVAKKRMGAAE